MSNQYYYAAASLPLLIFDKPSQISDNEFLEICKTNLSEDIYQIIAACKFPIFSSKHKKNKIAKDYWNFEKKLKNKLVKIRAENLELDYKAFVKEGEIYNQLALDYAANIVKQDNAYEAEKYLNKACWQFIDDLSINNFANLNFFVAYYIKLQINLRQNSFNFEKGKENYNIAYKNIINKLDEDFASGEEI